MIEDRTRRLLDVRLARDQAGQRLPSVAARVAGDGELLWTGGRGHVDDREPDASTQYRAGSISETFIASAVLMLRDAGRLSLSDPIGKYLDEGVARFRSGRRHHYSNVGYALLGALLTAQHGLPWYDVIARDLLAPLGMGRTTTRPQRPHAAGYAVHPYADALLAEPEHDAGAMLLQAGCGPRSVTSPLSRDSCQEACLACSPKRR